MAMVARVAKFYRPDEVPNETITLEPVKAMEIRRLQEYYKQPPERERDEAYDGEVVWRAGSDT